MECYSAKKTETLVYATTWIYLKNIFSERRHTQKVTHCRYMNTLIIRVKADMWVPKPGRRRGAGEKLNGHRVSFGGDGNILKLNRRDCIHSEMC